MTLHMVAGVMRPAGGLLLFGANDEGIKSAASRLSPMFGGARRAATGGHCRAIFATRAPQPGPLRDTLDQWQSTLDPQLEGLSDTWVTFPGVFAHGSLDPGTALLIGALPKDLSGQHVLDYGAGTGIIGGVCGGRGATVDLLDVDTVALAAARINVPSATLFAADNLSAVPSNYDAIVSNPPIHRGKAETHDVLEALIRDAPDHLNENGALYLVVQRRVPIETALGAAFGSVERVADDAVFKVLRARDR